MSDFDRLHPSLQHHVVNSLGWKSLRPVQERCIGPVLDGKNILVLAPTAGGKTEAAIFPLLSRALAEGWTGLSILYICPIKALLNNLLPRLEHYCNLVGRQCGLWHGDVSDSQRRAMLAEPPDILLTTPESLEVMLVMRHRKHPQFLAGIRAVVVDEMHAFAGDDRGWHLLSVLQRIERIVGRPLQRLGLSATIGNAADLLSWLADSGKEGAVIDGTITGGPEPEVQLDQVKSLENAATVIASLHRGEKRLVFCDSRSRVEELARMLRERDVDTFVSHSSLSADERKQAEAAFAGRSNCVIVATSTLELGIDVGDLDRVIQVDSPSTVASFLQRIGRTGRRTGRRTGTRRNCLFLATDRDALLQAAGLIELWSSGFVEPVQPPPLPLHIFAQQIMALALQEGGLARDRWPSWLAKVPGFAAMPREELESLIDFMISSQILSSDNGLLWLGEKGEKDYGRRHFMELLSCFTSPPLFRVLHGQREIGLVDQISFVVRQESTPVILLAGRNWQVTHLDWEARTAFVVPSKLRGRSQWMGSGPPLTYELCQAIRRVIVGDGAASQWSRRACEGIETLRTEMPSCRPGQTTVVSAAPGSSAWWTFGGLRANATLAEAFHSECVKATADNLLLVVHVGIDTLQAGLLNRVRAAAADLWPASLVEGALDNLKFSECLPKDAAERVLRARLSDGEAARRIVRESVRFGA